MPPDLALRLLELSLSRTYFHGSKGVRAIEVLLYVQAPFCHEKISVPNIDSKNGMVLKFSSRPVNINNSLRLFFNFST